jgi:predicted nucleic-acid-binding protein
LIAVDTNILVRLVSGDHPKQSAVAKALFAENSIWLSATVLLEAGWVLESIYELEAKEIAQVFWKILGLENVAVENRSGIEQALRWIEKGMDLADAFHLSLRPNLSRFMTFDLKMVKHCAREGLKDVQLAST